MFDVNYFMKVLIFGQPLFWMWLYDRDFDFSAYRNTFFILGGSFCVVTLAASVNHNTFGFGYYTAWLLFLYAFMVMWAVFTFEEKYSFNKALCLGFLVTYLNSYVWEFMLHFTSYLTYGITTNDLVQMQHLIVLVWLLYKFKFHVEKNIFIRRLQTLLLGETMIAFFIIEFNNGRVPAVIPVAMKYFLMNLNRLGSLDFIIIHVRYLAIDKNYKGIVFKITQGVADEPNLKEYLD